MPSVCSNITIIISLVEIWRLLKMSKQQPEGVYLYINDSGERFIAIIDAFGMANMLPWMQPGETDNIIEKSWNLTGDFIKLRISE